MTNRSWIALIAAVIIVAGLAYIIKKNNLGIFTMPSPEVVSESIFATSTVRDFTTVQSTLTQQARERRYYTTTWKYVTQFTYNNRSIIVGWLESKYGNGVIDEARMPIFLVDGTMYYPLGYSGNTYPLPETNWKPRYREVTISQFGPMELFIYGYESEQLEHDLSIIKRIAGFDGLTFFFDTNGRGLSARVITGGETRDATDPIVRYQDIEFVKIPENSETLDPIAEEEKRRKLAGRVTATSTLAIGNGVLVTYPSVINGLGVVPFTKREGEGSYGFYTGDREYDQDTIHITCSEFGADQAGPRASDPYPIAINDRSLVKDWGFSKIYQQDIFTFTGPHQHCTISASGIFRLNMLSISFQK